MPSLPPCPVCGTNRKVSAYPSGKQFHCGRCGGMFDDDPDEGGSAYNDPEKSAIKREEQERRQRHSPRRY